MNANEMKIGMLVTVGNRFVMGDRIGRGTMEADEWTGRTFRIVAIRHSKITGQDSAALALSNLVGVDESDEVVDIGCGRLTAAGEWAVEVSR